MKTFIRWATFALALAFVAVAPTFADDCVDTDGDDYVTCDGCTAGGDDSCGDCAEGDSDINPDETEVCDGDDNDCDGTVDDIPVPDPIDGVDNDIDGLIDEGFAPCIFHQEGPANECKTGGATLCVDGALTCVNPNGADAIIHYSDETLAAGNCADGVNNDCDSEAAAGDGIDNDGDDQIDEAGEVKELTDLKDTGCQQPEICDGLDNDGVDGADNGFAFGPCSVGVGECVRHGSLVCNDAGDDTECSANPGNPKNEGAQFGLSCDNGDDDDCDGLTDLADADCAGFGQDELCGNGIDDDGDGLTDEGFANLGLACSNGTGACAALGTYVCAGDGVGTVCGATPGDPVDEDGVSGNCADDLDNDCDGLTDEADGGCSGTYEDLGAWCSLPYTNAKPGSDCGSKSIIRFGSAAGTVSAQLLAYDVDGNLIRVMENIKNGDELHMLSRIPVDNWKFVTQLKPKGGASHTMFAPMPFLRVTATGAGGNEDVAWCSIMPNLDVTDPDGLTLSLSEGSDLEVKANIPLVDVDTLTISMDGIDLLGGLLGDLGLVKAAALPTGNTPLCTAPGSCVISVPAGCGDAGNVDVEIRNLRVEGADTAMAADIKAGIPLPNQVNTLSFQVIGLPPGGHVFHLNGSPLPILTNLANTCHLDDTEDTGIASAFGIRIDSPTPLQQIASAPVHVVGKVCGGNEITNLEINGKVLDVSIPTHQTCSTVVDPTVDAPECVVDFDEPMDETDLQEAIAGTAALGTFKRGGNYVLANAQDAGNNRTFNTNVLFSLGPVQTPNVVIGQSLRNGAGSAIEKAYEELAATVVTTIDPAFVVGLEESAVQKFFNEKCQGAIDTFTARAEANLQGDTFGTLDAEPGCSCNLYDVPIVLEELTFTPTSADPACAVEFVANQINVTINLPSITVQVGAHDSCTDHGIFGECIARTKIDVTAVTKVEDLSFSFTITETQIETKTPPSADSQIFTWTVVDPDGNPLFLASGTCANGDADKIGDECFGDLGCGESAPDGSCVGVQKNDDFDAITDNDSGIECWGAAVCSVFQFIGLALIEIFTLGFADGADIVGLIDFDFDFKEDFFAQLKASDPDPLELEEVQVDPNKVAAVGTTKFTPGPIDVEIEDGGLSVTFGGDFEVVVEDPSQPIATPPVLTQAVEPSVTQLINTGDEISVLLADDVFNQVFYAMKQAGKLTAFCTNADALTVDDLLPDDCASIALATDLKTFTAQGLCYGARLTDCETLTGTTAFNTGTMQGACHGIQHHDCPTIPAANPIAERGACNLAKHINILAADSILTCGRLDTEPDLLFHNDNAADNTVNTDLLLNDLNLIFVLDRANDGYTGKLEDLQGCLGAAGSEAADCKIYAACLDLALKTRMGIDNSTCSPTETGFIFDLLSVEKTGFAGGVLCSAGGTPTDDQIVVDAGVESDATDAVADSAEAFSPPFCVDGLTLGGVLNFTSADSKMFAITTTGAEPGFADFLGLTGGLGN